MAAIDSLLDQLVNRSGAFSPLTPFRSERAMQRYLAPAVARAGGDIATTAMQAESADFGSMLRAQGGLIENREREKGAITRQGMQDKTALARQNLINTGQQIVQAMQNEGMLKRTGMMEEGLMGRLKTGARLEGNELDNTFRRKLRLMELDGQPGDVSAVDIINEAERARPVAATPVRKTWSNSNIDDEDIVNHYSMGSLIP